MTWDSHLFLFIERHGRILSSEIRPRDVIVFKAEYTRISREERVKPGLHETQNVSSTEINGLNRRDNHRLRL